MHHFNSTDRDILKEAWQNIWWTDDAKTPMNVLNGLPAQQALTPFANPGERRAKNRACCAVWTTPSTSNQLCVTCKDIRQAADQLRVLFRGCVGLRPWKKQLLIERRAHQAHRKRHVRAERAWRARTSKRPQRVERTFSQRCHAGYSALTIAFVLKRFDGDRAQDAALLAVSAR
jgi:hypothetical protein